MPKNKVIYVGVLIVAASALLWIGAVLLSQLKDMFPYFLVFGVVLIVAGIAMELKKNADSKKNPPTPPAS